MSQDELAGQGPHATRAAGACAALLWTGTGHGLPGVAPAPPLPPPVRPFVPILPHLSFMSRELDLLVPEIQVQPGRTTCEPEPFSWARTMQRGGTDRYKLHTSHESTSRAYGAGEGWSRRLALRGE